MADQSAKQTFFFEIFLPFGLLVFVLFGLPQILIHFVPNFASAQHAEPNCPPNPSPPASGTGPPVTGDGGETG